VLFGVATTKIQRQPYSSENGIYQNLREIGLTTYVLAKLDKMILLEFAKSPKKLKIVDDTETLN